MALPESPLPKDQPPEPARKFPECYYPAALLLALATFAVYLYTLAPALMPGDSGDFVQGAATFRQIHPPGYPLFAALGKLFAFLPIGNIAYRINVMAAVLGGLAVASLFLGLVILTRHALASLAGALLFAFNYLFWTYFIQAETFCLNNFFLAFTFFLAMLWRERHRQAPGSAADRQMLSALAFTCGLSLGNHHTMVLTFPGLVLFAIAVDRSVLRPARLLQLALWSLLGLVLAYLYLPVAAMVNSDFAWEDTRTLHGVLRVFLRKKYGTFQLAPGKGDAITPLLQSAGYFKALLTAYLLPGFALGIAGLLVAARRHRLFLLYSLPAFLVGCLFVAKANIDPRQTGFEAATVERFFQLPNFFFLLWAAIGLAALARAAEEVIVRHAESGSASRPAARWIVGVAMLALPAALFIYNYPQTSMRGRPVFRRFVDNVFNSIPKDSIFLTWSDSLGFGGDYYLKVEKHRPDIMQIHMGIVGAEPYRSTVRRQFPNLYWPKDIRWQAQGIHDFLVENLKHHRVFMDGAPNKNAIKLPAVRYGLIYEILPEGSKPPNKQIFGINNALWAHYDLRQVDTTLYPPDSMLYSLVVFYYLFQRFSFATECNLAGYYAEALRHLEACARMDRYGYVVKTPPWRRQMAFSHLGLGDVQQAIAELDQVRQEAPEDSATYALLAAAYRKLGDKAKAEEYQKQCAERRKKEASTGGRRM